MVMLNIEIPVSAPLKTANKERLIEEVVSSFKAVGVSDVKIADSHYVDLRSDIEPLAFILIIQVIANIVIIVRGLKEFLKKPEAKGISEFRLKTDSESIAIKGEMSSEDITKILEKVKKVEKKEST